MPDHRDIEKLFDADSFAGGEVWLIIDSAQLNKTLKISLTELNKIFVREAP